MNQRDDTIDSRSGSPAQEEPTYQRSRPLRGRFPASDMPSWLLLLLAALGLPRTVLADLGIVRPESGPLYYVLALTPFAAWLAVAIIRENRRPVLDFLVLGTLYGLSLVLVHQLLWGAGASLGHQPPDSAVGFADLFSPGRREFVLRIYTSGIAMLIGLGTGVVAAGVAAAARAWRTSRARRANRRS
ncbi:hypothetical protein SAMN05421678_10637 [Actinopolymorpha cephalotaxi]|uniref:Uncharacterized protein n=1 Tax=Actinopolymorpha cephalotaxi TaxID=504797 RepID=A0A1I2RYA6_9ACTN|nr:hypothetical protein [Actinopolymorpha cephalotaxi]NYH83835.1 hypothetical protein [Actinopolymorpha cephalotaxi]SFG45542.1 hypothetical protein SAMN05421678_10637 [Actinopolymorpha cephalotaxi]